MKYEKKFLLGCINLDPTMYKMKIASLKFEKYELSISIRNT